MKDSVAYGNFRGLGGTQVADDVDQNLPGANVTLEGNNLIGFRSGNAMTGGTGSVTEGYSAANDPGFLALADNGGAVLPSGAAARTHALTFGASSLIDAATSSVSTEDQRGILRPSGAARDIGAFESPGTLYVNDNWAGTAASAEVDGDLELAGNQVAFFGVEAFSSVADALTTHAGFAGNIVVNGGTYGTVDLTGGGAVNLQFVQDLANSENDVIITTLDADADDSIELRYHGTAEADLIVQTGTVAGVISGAGSVTKTGGGNFVLTNNASTYSGGTEINGGILRATHNESLGANSGTLSIP